MPENYFLCHRTRTSILQEVVFKGALSAKITWPPSVEEVAALACQRTISFAIKLGLQEVVFEGDSEILIKILNLDCTSCTRFCHLVDEPRASTSKLGSCFFSYVRRDYNRVADKLAKISKFLFLLMYFMTDFPC